MIIAKAKTHPTLLPVGVVSDDHRVALLQTDLDNSEFRLSWVDRRGSLELDPKKVIFKKALTIHNPLHCSNFRFSYVGRNLMTYTRTFRGRASLVVASSKDLYVWNVISETEYESLEFVFVTDDKPIAGSYLAYEGGVFVRGLTSPDLKKWNDGDQYLFTSRAGSFDAENVTLLNAFDTDRGIALMYESRKQEADGSMKLFVGGALFDRKDMRKMIWRSDEPLWETTIPKGKGAGCAALGAVILGDRVVAYWRRADGRIISADIVPFGRILHKPRIERVVLKRHELNPILVPHPHNEWENEAVFNPGAVIHNDDVHLFYRAMGPDGISRIGYAASEDGFNFDERLSHPIYHPSKGFDVPEKGGKGSHGPLSYAPAYYPSGGGWGGCEDPRAVKIGRRIYLTYVAFGGWDSMRMAMTSISVSDFNKQQWNWKKPVLISPPGVMSKNWVLFPEKVDGKFAILHSITPDVLVEYVDDLGMFERNKMHIKSRPPSGGRREFWDTKVRGAGPPPIKTDLGWLVLYHATDSFDPNRYKLGAMILDLENPKKILYRSSEPILTPEMPYENEGKPGVVYASGAVVKDGHLLVYYGGGDRVTCVASVPLQEFLNDIIKDKQIKLSKCK
ncbi:MAG: hypothetical protein JWO73_499 [Candidatus Taylorbacteria bacterium]|nr:hypothetical protein [Candidatus Taylorbacteria bacterium]